MENNEKILRVYRKKSTFKGATANDVWYSATRSDGASVNCVFKCDVPDESAFTISNVVGSLKHKTVEKSGEVYENYTYYITSCNFGEMPTEELPL